MHTHFVAFILASLPQGLGQGPEVTEKEARAYRYFQIPQLLRGGTLEPQWMPDGNSFWYAEGAPDHTVIWMVDTEDNLRSQFFDTDTVRAEVEKVTGKKPKHHGLPFETFTFQQDGVTIRFRVEDREFEMEPVTGTIRSLPEISEEEQRRSTAQLVRKGFIAGEPDVMELASPDHQWFAFESGHEMWVRSSKENQRIRITNDYESADQIHAAEGERFGWSVEGALWTPDSRQIAASRVSIEGVARLPIVHWLKVEEEVEFAPYTKAGGVLPRTHWHFLDVAEHKKTPIQDCDWADHYYMPVAFTADARELLMLRVDRLQKRLDLLACDRRSGGSRVILSEKQASFIEGLRLYEVWQAFYTPVGDGKRFVWMSERDGWNHLYLYDLAGQELVRLTRGEFPVQSVVAVDAENQWVYFTAHAEEDLYDAPLYRVNFEGEGFTRLTGGDGQHQVFFAPSKQSFVDTWSTAAIPPRTELRKADGTFLSLLSEADLSGLKVLDWQPPEEFVAKAADGTTDLYGVLCRPPNFDPACKYPVIDYIYNGPQTTWVPRSFLHSSNLVIQSIAQLGFFVMVVDGRGTPERGKAFQDVVYRKFGQHEIPDHAAVLRELASGNPSIDLKRVGIFGGSWGGYMTIRALVTHPDVYQVGVAVNPVADLYDHAASPIEPYMELPQNNREGYEAASNTRLAANLKGKLMLVHGTSDVNATFSATMKFVHALIQAGRPHDLVVLPEANHHPTGLDAQYFWQRTMRYFEQHLNADAIVRVEEGS